MKKYIIIILMLLFQASFSQVELDYVNERNNFNLSLIKKDKQGLNSKKLNSNEKYLGNFLGKITTNKNGVLFIVTNSYVFNLKNSPTAENHIFIYNEKMQCIGYYYLTLTNELPIKILKNKLYFKNKLCKECLILSFNQGIPKSFNLKCNGEDNFYEFQFLKDN
jgi:hypothetical protein